MKEILAIITVMSVFLVAGCIGGGEPAGEGTPSDGTTLPGATAQAQQETALPE